MNCKLFNGNLLLDSLFKAIVDIKLYRVRSRNLDEKLLWQSLYGNKKFNAIKFRRALSDLAKLSEDFLAWEKYQNKTLEKENNLLHSYYEMNVDKFFIQAERQAMLSFQKFPYRDGEYYAHLYKRQSMSNSFQIKHLQRKSNVNYAEIDESLNTFYIIQKLKLYCELLNSKSIIHIEQSISQIEEIIEFVESHHYLKIPAIQIYYLISKTFTANDRKHFDLLKEFLNEHVILFTSIEGKNLYGYLFNFCIRNINKGNHDFLRELFRLYDITLQNNIIFDNNILSPWDYKNIVTTGLRLNEYEWTENFIINYKNKLPPSHRSNAYIYNTARLLFEKQHYKNALKMLQNVEFNDVFYSLDARVLLIKSYYELKDWDAIEYGFSSFQQYLRREKSIAHNHKTNYSNFIKITKLLYKVSINKGTKPDIHSHLDKIIYIADKGWLQTKIKELSTG